MNVPRWIFWVCAGLVVYTYLGYPLLLFVLAVLKQAWRDLRFAVGKNERRRQSHAAFEPMVSLVFSAYNEEAVIAEKMRNLALLDYPDGQLEILVGCDGCTDRTAELARSSQVASARVIEFSPRSGKLNVVNRLVEQARGEIVVFCDANTMLRPDAAQTLIRHFRDDRVGCVCGEIRLSTPAGSPRTEGVYWRYEVFLKFLESRLGLLLGANGGLYAIRRRLFTPLPPNGINEDFLIPMSIRRAGYHLRYDPEAVGYEDETDITQDFRRHVRIGAGNFHALGITARLLSPFSGGVSFSYWSHKVFRWLVPFALPVMFFSALAVSRDPFYAACAAGMAVAGGLAGAGYCLESRKARHAALTIPYYFFAMNLALAMGFFRFLVGRQNATWDRTARATGPESPTLTGKAAEGGA